MVVSTLITVTWGFACTILIPTTRVLSSMRPLAKEAEGPWAMFGWTGAQRKGGRTWWSAVTPKWLGRRGESVRRACRERPFQGMSLSASPCGSHLIRTLALPKLMDLRSGRLVMQLSLRHAARSNIASRRLASSSASASTGTPSKSKKLMRSCRPHRTRWCFSEGHLTDSSVQASNLLCLHFALQCPGGWRECHRRLCQNLSSVVVSFSHRQRTFYEIFIWHVLGLSTLSQLVRSWPQSKAPDRGK